MSPSVTISSGTCVHHLPLHFQLEEGGALIGGQLAYELSGPDAPPSAGSGAPAMDLAAPSKQRRHGSEGPRLVGGPGGRDAPVVVVLGGISADRHAAAHAGDPAPGWWDDFVGRGRAIDTERFSVLGVDWLGGAGASTGPDHYDADAFPIVTSGDQANAIASLLDELGIAAVHAWIGSSYGGMVGLSFAARHPGRVERLCTLGAAHESHPMATAWRSVQRGVVRLGQRAGCTDEAVALARGLAMATYRSHREFAERFGGGSRRVDDTLRFPVEDYLQARGRAFAGRFSAASFLRLSESIDHHRVDPAQVTVPTTLVSFDSDQLVPATQVRELARRLPRLLAHHDIETHFGHDAFLKERDAVSAVLREVLR